jgi:folate-dependent phosphoribosylglycinamide formyltransferase PurN
MSGEAMPTTPIFDPAVACRPMRVAAFMSGSGTNIRKLLEHQAMLDRDRSGAPYRVTFIFSDRSDGACAGESIALEYGLPYFSYDIRAFHRLRGINRTVRTPQGMAARKAYDQLADTLVRAFDIDVIALGGYMSYTTMPRCVNVHPADLSLLTPAGDRKFVGDDAIREALLAGEKSLRASTLWTDEGVDTGPLLMVSDPVHVVLPEPLESLARDDARLAELVEVHQNRLKERGDWKIFPRTVQLIAQGRFALDEGGRVYLDGAPVPEGYRERN